MWECVFDQLGVNLRASDMIWQGMNVTINNRTLNSWALKLFLRISDAFVVDWAAGTCVEGSSAREILDIDADRVFAAASCCDWLDWLSHIS